MIGIGKHICTKVVLFRLAIVFLSLCGLLAANRSRVSGFQDRGPESGSPQVLLLDATQLQKSRAAIKSGDKTLAPAWSRLEREADKAMSNGPFSVMSKGATPPSDDKHDYMSQ